MILSKLQISFVGYDGTVVVGDVRVNKIIHFMVQTFLLVHN